MHVYGVYARVCRDIKRNEPKKRKRNFLAVTVYVTYTYFASSRERYDVIWSCKRHYHVPVGYGLRYTAYTHPSLLCIQPPNDIVPSRIEALSRKCFFVASSVIYGVMHVILYLYICICRYECSHRRVWIYSTLLAFQGCRTNIFYIKHIRIQWGI